MKILLLGEFSGLFSNLRDGLLEIKENVKFFSDQDGWKKIDSADEPINSMMPTDPKAGFAIYKFLPLFDRRYNGFDIVQAVSPSIFSVYINYRMFKRIKKENGKLFINLAGADFPIYDSYMKHEYDIDYYYLDDNKEACDRFSDVSLKNRIARKVCSEKVLGLADGLIPCVPYEYTLPYKKYKTLRGTILLPINTKKINYKPNKLYNGKIVFFHGISRPADKGSFFITSAMNRIATLYPNDVECICVEKLPYNEYVEVMERTNVVIDQCKSFGYGMNACIALAKGKVVLSGAEQLVLSEGGITDCPVINIRPDVDDIVNKMIWIIETRYKLEELGFFSRQYIEKEHDYIKIAEQYINEWKM